MNQWQCLAETLLDTHWDEMALQKVVVPFTTPKSIARKQLVSALLAEFTTPPSRSKLLAFLSRNASWSKINWAKVERHRRLDINSYEMRRAVKATFIDSILPLPTVGQFADWCDLPVGLIDWLSKDRNAHYRVSTTPKRSGGLRIVEAPRARLKALQRKIAFEILQSVPCHSAAHGFIRGRSALTFVGPHVGKSVVLRMDLQDFFPTIDASRVFGLFRSVGYPHVVTQLLTDLCTTVCNEEQLESLGSAMVKLRSLYCRKHLPQGAPTSPAIANLIAYSLDTRLSGLAKYAGVEYTRYADDLLFSGPERFSRFVRSFSIRVGSIAMDEGFQVQFRKTRIMRAATRQTAAGIVLNQCTNLKRVDYDRLKAILWNCVRFGPSSQNRNAHPEFQAHLRGRVNWIRQLHPVRGEKLASVFQSIDWSA
jgi:RNA-directed DNA polymerase